MREKIKIIWLILLMVTVGISLVTLQNNLSKPSQNEMHEIIQEIIDYEYRNRTRGSVILCDTGLYGYIPTYANIVFNLMTLQELQKLADEKGEPIKYHLLDIDDVNRNLFTGKINGAQYVYGGWWMPPSEGPIIIAGGGEIIKMSRTREGWKFKVIGICVS